MKSNPLILGGTSEATALCRALSDAGIGGTISLAGRVARPLQQPLPQRIGGFGGVSGLVQYLADHRISHVIDATHPFAAQMSTNAIQACALAHVPLIALSREPWRAEAGDKWTHVRDIAGAVTALNRPAARVMLAVGRMHLAEFSPNSQHFYLLRLIDAPEDRLPFPDHRIVLDRGPFTYQGDLELMRKNGINLVVSKNSGGTGARAKLAAARALGIPVVMIDRPDLPPRLETYEVSAVLDWLCHGRTDLGV